MAGSYEPSVVVIGEGHKEYVSAGVLPVTSDFAPGLPGSGDLFINRNPVHAGATHEYRYTNANGVALFEAHIPELIFAVTLTNAQILAMNTTPVLVVPAMGANTLIEVVSVVLENVYGTAAFASGGALQLSYGAAITTPASVTVAATFLTSPAAKQIILAAGALSSQLASAVENVAIYITNATGNFTTGDGTVNVRVTVRVHGNLA